MKLNEVIAEEVRKYVITENLQYHLDLGLSLTESVFRIGSDAHDEMIREVRSLYEQGVIELLDKDDVFIMENTNAGKTAIYFDETKLNEGDKKGVYDGEKVTLDNPTRTSGGDKKFRVYVDSGKKTADGETKAKKVEWGSPDYEIKNDDPEASKSFRARHKCSEKTDRTKAGWWACNVHKYHKQLGLSSDSPW